MNDLTATFNLIVKSPDPFPVDFDQAWKWIGYSRKDVALDALKAGFIEGEDFAPGKTGAKTGSGGHNKVAYRLTTDCFKDFCMMAGTAKGKEVRRYFRDVEKRYLAILKDKRIRIAVRREFTDLIQHSPLNEAMHGWAYKTLTDLIYRQVLGMDARHFRQAKNLDEKANVRDHLTTIQLLTVERLERLAGAMVDLGQGYEQIKLAIVNFGKPQLSKGAA